MFYVYIAGPYTKGDVVENVRTAIQAADELRAAGLVPFVPHLTHLWHLVSPHDWQFWIDYDLKWLKLCDYILRLHGESAGADIEVQEAKALGIPVYYSVQHILEVVGLA